MSEKISVNTTVNAPIEKVWTSFTDPQHITKWNNASDDWHSPRAENDLRVGGKFNYRMESRDGKNGFDFIGTYDEVIPFQRIAYTMDDGRKVRTDLSPVSDQREQVLVTTVFEAETENTIELQRSGWQSILDNFKKYTESL